MQAILLGILEKQKSTAPVQLTIGTTIDRTVVTNCLVIQDAPPAIVSWIMNQSGYTVGMSNRGMTISLKP